MRVDGGGIGRRTPLRVARDAVIRFLLDAQHLAHGGAGGPGTAPTPPAVLREIRHLEGVQIDPVSVVERNQHLVLAARLPGYELDILTMIGQAKSIPAIAASRGISHKTVRNHLANIYRKLDLRSRTEAMLCAARMGLAGS